MVKMPRLPAASTASFSSRSSTLTARMGPSGGVASPKRFRSALLYGRSHANDLPRTNHVRWPNRAPSVTSGRSAMIRSTSSIVATSGQLGVGRFEQRAHPLDVERSFAQRIAGPLGAWHREEVAAVHMDGARVLGGGVVHRVHDVVTEQAHVLRVQRSAAGVVEPVAAATVEPVVLAS